MSRHRTKAEVVAEALRALNGLRERMESARQHMAAGPVSVLLLEQVRADISDTGAMLAPLFAAQEVGTLDIQALVEGQIFPSPGAEPVDYVALWQAAYAASEAVWPTMRDAVAGRTVATWGDERARITYLTLTVDETAPVRVALTTLIDVLAQG
jgi:hypothetical protein